MCFGVLFLSKYVIYHYQRLHAPTHTRTCTRTHAHTYVHTHTRTCTRTPTHTDTQIYFRNWLTPRWPSCNPQGRPAGWKFRWWPGWGQNSFIVRKLQFLLLSPCGGLAEDHSRSEGNAASRDIGHARRPRLPAPALASGCVTGRGTAATRTRVWRGTWVSIRVTLNWMNSPPREGQSGSLVRGQGPALLLRGWSGRPSSSDGVFWTRPSPPSSRVSRSQWTFYS